VSLFREFQLTIESRYHFLRTDSHPPQKTDRQKSEIEPSRPIVRSVEVIAFTYATGNAILTVVMSWTVADVGCRSFTRRMIVSAASAAK
jgi:hypothetical protein